MKIRNGLSLTIVVLGVIMLISCATKIPVQVLKPAEMNIGPVKKVAILDFDFRGHWDLYELDKTLLGLLFKEEEVPPPDPLEAYPGKNVAAQFSAKLVENGHFTVIEREQLSKVLDENKLSLSALMDAGQAVEVGKLLGVDALIIGSGNYSVSDVGEQANKKTKEGKIIPNYRITRKVHTQLTYKIVNVATGLIVGSKTNSVSNYEKPKGEGLFTLTSAADRPPQYISDGKDEKAAFKGLPDWNPLVSHLVDKMLEQSVQQIAPYYVEEQREIKGGKTPAMKIALDYAKRDLWDDAKSTWEEVLTDKSADGMKDEVPAKFNLGIYYEINGDLAKAEDYFQQCYKKSGETDYLDARARIQARIKELEKLKEQQGDK